MVRNNYKGPLREDNEESILSVQEWLGQRRELVIKAMCELMKEKEDTKMSRVKELFGVEIGEVFDIKERATSRTGNWKGCYFDTEGQLRIPGLYWDYETSRTVISALIIGNAEIINRKRSLLTEEEREFLKALSNPKFHRGGIECFTKSSNVNETYHIEIFTDPYTNGNRDRCYSFDFDKDLFKGMEANKQYTPEELGL